MVAATSSFLGELRRRNIVRAAALYAAAAWLLVQVATQVFPFFHISESVVRGIVVAAIVCLPVFLAFTWFYEIHARRVSKRQSEVPRAESITPSDRAQARPLDHRPALPYRLAAGHAAVDRAQGRW